MSTTEKPDPESIEASAGAPRSPQPPPPPSGVYFKVDVALRGLLFAATTVALFVMATAEQTKGIMVPGVSVTVRNPTKFDQSPALIYFVSALTVASLYSLLTTITSIGVMLNPHLAIRFLLHFAFWDVLMLGIVSAATGTAGGVAYIALKGNSHVGWVKICNTYDKFCQHIAASLAFSLFASVLLVLLVMLSTLSLHSKIR